MIGLACGGRCGRLDCNFIGASNSSIGGHLSRTVGGDRRRYSSNREEFLQRTKKHQKQVRAIALRLVADFYGRPIECMVYLTPDLPSASLPCQGPLQLDHIGGDGKDDRDSHGHGTLGVCYDIVAGKRDLNKFRILCRYHNLTTWRGIGGTTA